MLSSPRTRRPPRRTSCDQCIKAKRRCDQASNACIRCTKQKLQCRYSTFSSQSTTTPAPNTTQHENSIEPDQVEGVDMIVAAEPIPCGPCSTTSPDTVTRSEDLLSPNFDDLLFDYEFSQTVHPPTEAVISLPSSQIRALFASHMEYGVGKLKLSLWKMVHETQTPWSHPLLYEEHMPKSMHDAIGACALYLAKNTKNSKIVLEHIELRVTELLSTPPSNALLDLLSQLQSLILYQIIRIFDGDILARSQASLTFPTLETYASSLQSVISTTPPPSPPPNNTPLYPPHPLLAFHKSYILHESTHRTLLLTYYLLSLYSLQTGLSFCHSHSPLSSLFTASRYLWEAEDFIEFWKAWREKRHFVVRDLEFGELVGEGRGEDLDCFGRILMVSFLGWEAARGWFEERGGGL